jgi:broad specificity phosphatase PhoE
MSVVYLVRHGQASFGAAEYDQLTGLGVEQARVLGAALRSRLASLDAVIVGGRERHRKTAETCLEAVGRVAALVEDAAFDEFDHKELLARFDARYADLSAIVADVSAAEDPWRAFDDLFRRAIERWRDAGPDAGYRESFAAFRARCASGLDRLVAALPRSSTAMVFTSGGPIAMIAAGLLGLPPDGGLDLRWGLVNCGVTKVVSSGRGTRLASLNEQGHLEHDRRLITYR